MMLNVVSKSGSEPPHFMYAWNCFTLVGVQQVHCESYMFLPWVAKADESQYPPHLVWRNVVLEVQPRILIGAVPRSLRTHLGGIDVGPEDGTQSGQQTSGLDGR